jgi:hypothetical protein
LRIAHQINILDFMHCSRKLDFRLNAELRSCGKRRIPLQPDPTGNRNQMPWFRNIFSAHVPVKTIIISARAAPGVCRS